MKKYRIRLLNDRVIGPYSIEEIKELKAKAHITCDEEVQIFPTGDWRKWSSYAELAEISTVIEVPDRVEEATFIKKINLEDLNVQSADDIIFPRKFDYKNNINPVLEDAENPSTEDSVVEDSTLVISREQLNSQVEDKTVVNLNTKNYLDELRKAKSDAIRDAVVEEEVQDIKELDVEEVEPDFNNGATQFLDLNTLKEELLGDIEIDEENLFAIEHDVDEDIVEVQEEEEVLEKNSGEKRKKIIFFTCFLAIVYVLLFPEEKVKNKIKKINFKAPSISFPIRFDKPDSKKAGELYKKGMLEYKKGSYISLVKASNYFRQSVENKFNDNLAAAKLILTYSRLLDNSDERDDDANTIFKLVQIFKNKSLLDPHYASALAMFYLKIEKYNASVNTVEKYNAIKKSNPTIELYSIYLSGLLKTGDLVKAKAIVKKMETVPISKRSIYTNLSLIDYYITLGDYESPSQIVASLKKLVEFSIPLELRRAYLLLYSEDFKSLELLLKKLRLKNLGGSKVFYSKYLEYMGFLFVKKKNVKVAQKYFQKALILHESLDLRSKLASLYQDGIGDQSTMIAESKSLQLIASSKQQMRKKNWKFAFKDALEANRIVENFIPARVHLAKLQIQQSLFGEAIRSLELMYKKNSKNPEIIFTLVDAYIESYKFTDVKRILTILNTTELRAHSDYTSLTAKYYSYRDNFRSSVNWLQKAINRNPLNDKNLSTLAELYIKYNKFNKAKVTLNKAMDLDPAKVEYRISYSSILYESDGADAAIGYLYDILQDFPDNSKILSQIGIFYYRSGQIKYFETIKKKLKSIPNKDSTLFDFLIKAASLDGDLVGIIENSKKKISLDPGDLKTRLQLGKVYMENDKYKEALEEFKAIEQRLETYPALQLYMSNLYLLTDNFEEAARLAQKEIKANSSNEQGYIMLGNIYSRQKKYIEAEKQFKKAQRLDGENVDMLIGLAKISFKKSQYDLALDLFLKARENAPERPEVHKLLGDAYRKLSQSSLAIESYKLFLELSPRSKYKDEINTFIRAMR